MNGSLLRELRKAKGFGQRNLADRVGVSQGMISQLEVGCRNPLPDTLEAIARVLGCTCEDLAGEPSEYIRLMRNCKGLLPAQLIALNEVVLQLKAVDRPQRYESAGTTTNRPSTKYCSPQFHLACRKAGCVECPHCRVKV